jgi:phosphopantothenoylcysteine decarboxylase/phosphopantothenate--cysteine ligase
LNSIRLIRNPDILASLARRKKRNQIFIGFGLESSDLVRRGLEILKAKSLNLLVLQQVTDAFDPFGDNPVEALVLDAEKTMQRFGPVTKKQLAAWLVKEAERLHALK